MYEYLNQTKLTLTMPMCEYVKTWIRLPLRRAEARGLSRTQTPAATIILPEFHVPPITPVWQHLPRIRYTWHALLSAVHNSHPSQKPVPILSRNNYNYHYTVALLLSSESIILSAQNAFPGRCTCFWHIGYVNWRLSTDLKLSDTNSYSETTYEFPKEVTRLQPSNLLTICTHDSPWKLPTDSLSFGHHFGNLLSCSSCMQFLTRFLSH
jgi:hypothetical protein